MTETKVERASKVAAYYAAMVADFVAASDALKRESAPHATTLSAAYGAFAAGYVAAAAAADQAGTAAPFPLLPLGPPAAVTPIDVLTLADAATYLQLPEEVVRAEAEAGRIAGRTVGGSWRFVREDIIAWLRSPPRRANLPIRDETEEEFEQFRERIRGFRDEVDRATGSGKYAPE